MPPLLRNAVLRAHTRSANPRLLQQISRPGLALRLNSSLPPSSSEKQGPQKETEGTSQKTWLTRKVETSATAAYLFRALSTLLGYNSPKQNAGVNTMAMYNKVVSKQPDVDKAFWIEKCSMPPTFQTWFTITNLHLWMLTVRLRALPDPLGKFYVQALVDHFFMDIEDRIRDIYQPISPEKQAKKKYYTHRSDFYLNPNENLKVNVKGKLLRVRAPDRLIKQQMKIFKDQWSGMTLSLDFALVKGDQELAAAVWRNILGARGAQGIAYTPTGAARFRRQINRVGNEVDRAKLEKEETTDDGSGVHDFPPEQVDKYLAYPQLMLDIVGYIRRNLYAFEQVPDTHIYKDRELRWLSFGKVRRVDAEDVGAGAESVDVESKL